MIRIAILAAAAALVAASAAAQTTIRIPVAGKSAQQLDAEIVKAVRSVCLQETTGASFPLDAYAACRRKALADARAQLSGTALSALPPKRVAQR